MKKSRRTLLVLMTTLLAMILAFTSVSYAAGTDKNKEESTENKPKTVIHKVVIDNKQYCFFTDHYVVLTRAEIEEMTDEELTDAILERAGLYMIEANCTDPKHKKITPEDWTESHGPFMLYPDDIDALRAADPEATEDPEDPADPDNPDEAEAAEASDPKPIKFELDLLVYTEPLNEDDPEKSPEPYTTFKPTDPAILFVVVASEEDAKLGEELCEEEKIEEPKKPEKPRKEKPKKKTKTPKQKTKKPSIPKQKDPAESLPEYKTIPMADRSGEPVEDTLQDGKPVTLEWEEPGKKADSDKSSIIDRIPGRYAGLAGLAVALAAVVVAIIIIRKRQREEEFDD